jgi:simple sugar transport system ATP-binding protein
LEDGRHQTPELLRMDRITKSFGSLLADDAVTLDVRVGEIHALLGENGAGKSTLMKVLYGLHQPDSGEIWLDGRQITIGSPHEAVAHGIGMVHQQFMLVPNLTATENVILGMRAERRPMLDLAAARKRLVELAREYDLDVDPDAPVWQMSLGGQQRLEILKALFRGARLLVLDEPTAVLAPSEVGGLFRIMRQLASEGRGIVFISHKLSEVTEVSDHVTVLRLGRVTGTLPTREATAHTLATMMVGREISLARTTAPVVGTDTVLEISGVHCVTDRGTPGLTGVDLVVRKGEILGIAGVDGNGQRELVECIAGLRPVTAGTILVEGRPPSSALREPGLLGLVPEDRYEQGLIGDFDVSENLVLRAYQRPPYSTNGFLRWGRIRDNATQRIAAFDIRCPGPLAPVRSLSGGNQQKVVIARETQDDPALIVASQPTRGLDVGAVESVLNLLRQQRDRGAAVVFVSTELSEVLALSDRVVVMHKGEVMGEVPPDPAALGRIGEMMMGRSLESIDAGAVA